MTGKSDQAYKTIGEVAALLDLPQHVLRFWETKFRQVSPLKRGGGRRYYRPSDVELLRRIKSLLHLEGYTIKGVQRILGQGGVKALPDPLDSKKLAAAQPARAPNVDISALIGELENIRDLLRRSAS